ncbi:hypothetical protein I79_022928 [Cricetulus griseus]|uniref:Uncharacterized protein n=1 Tax=Cricetulus griseus TaxID=10029 RepID=G3IGK9_CRIGR|nr:hypothetical protein I79_022928 [Cricetulus griseus]
MATTRTKWRPALCEQASATTDQTPKAWVPARKIGRIPSCSLRMEGNEAAERAQLTSDLDMTAGKREPSAMLPPPRQQAERSKSTNVSASLPSARLFIPPPRFRHW